MAWRGKTWQPFRYLSYHATSCCKDQRIPENGFVIGLYPPDAPVCLGIVGNLVPLIIAGGPIRQFDCHEFVSLQTGPEFYKFFLGICNEFINDPGHEVQNKYLFLILFHVPFALVYAWWSCLKYVCTDRPGRMATAAWLAVFSADAFHLGP